MWRENGSKEKKKKLVTFFAFSLLINTSNNNKPDNYYYNSPAQLLEALLFALMGICLVDPMREASSFHCSIKLTRINQPKTKEIPGAVMQHGASKYNSNAGITRI